MPSIRPVHASSALKSAVRPYVCLSCLLQTAPARKQQHRALSNTNIPSSSTAQAIEATKRQTRTIQPRARRGPSHATRHFSRATTKSSPNGSTALAFRSAINAPSTVPPELRELHQQLTLLEENASSYVDLSRLKLALRSLESQDPVVRIAFVGLGDKGYQAARKLVRILCADALSDEAEWERKLLQANKDGGSLLLRYGEDNGQLGQRRGAVEDMQIPSLFLKKWNLEILINGLNAAATTSAEESGLEDSLLVPTLTIPGAGRVGFVRFPVHKTVVVAEGVSGALEFGRLPIFRDGRMVHAALNLPLRVTAAVEDGSTVDIDLAAHALALFRASNSNGAQFSSEWQASRVGSMSSWVAAAADASEGTHGVKPAIGDLVSGVLARTSNSISVAESSARSASTSLTVPEMRRADLQRTIATWSEKSHRDLQVNLAHALLSSTWRRTVWWRLFWRIDEVSLSASDVMIRGWLVEAEQNLACLSGRVIEAGLASAAQLKAEGDVDVKESVAALDGGPEADADGYKSQRIAPADKTAVGTCKGLGAAVLKRPPPVFIPISARDGRKAIFDPPWPQTIHFAREQTLYRAVPALHRKAQALMLSSLSTMGGSGALGAWLWVASGGTMLYEAGAIAALGLVWGLRRLQGKWSQERNIFVNTIVENGRSVLADVEARLRRLVETGGRVEVKADETKEWNAARQGVRCVQEALAKLGEGRK